MRTPSGPMQPATQARLPCWAMACFARATPSRLMASSWPSSPRAASFRRLAPQVLVVSTWAPAARNSPWMASSRSGTLRLHSSKLRWRVMPRSCRAVAVLPSKRKHSPSSRARWKVEGVMDAPGGDSPITVSRGSRVSLSRSVSSPRTRRGQELAPCCRRLPRFHRAFPSTFLDSVIGLPKIEEPGWSDHRHPSSLGRFLRRRVRGEALALQVAPGVLAADPVVGALQAPPDRELAVAEVLRHGPHEQQAQGLEALVAVAADLLE